MNNPDVNNTPDMLRKLAADIEAGMYGAVHCAAVSSKPPSCRPSASARPARAPRM